MKVYICSVIIGINILNYVCISCVVAENMMKNHFLQTNYVKTQKHYLN